MRKDRGRAIAMIAALVGALGSSALVLYVGRRNSSHWLIALFVLWVSSPFALLAYLGELAKLWTARARTLHCAVTIGLALITLAVYGNVVFGAPRPKPAAPFLIVPSLSWLAIAIGIAIARRRRSPNAS
jgi:hypothetical protein